eukprot:403346908
MNFQYQPNSNLTQFTSTPGVPTFNQFQTFTLAQQPAQPYIMCIVSMPTQVAPYNAQNSFLGGIPLIVQQQTPVLQTTNSSKQQNYYEQNINNFRQQQQIGHSITPSQNSHIITPQPLYHRQPKQTLSLAGLPAFSNLSLSTISNLSSANGSAFSALKKHQSNQQISINNIQSQNEQINIQSDENKQINQSLQNSIQTQLSANALPLLTNEQSQTDNFEKEEIEIATITDNTRINLTRLHQRAIEKEKLEKLMSDSHSHSDLNGINQEDILPMEDDKSLPDKEQDGNNYSDFDLSFEIDSQAQEENNLEEINQKRQTEQQLNNNNKEEQLIFDSPLQVNRGQTNTSTLSRSNSQEINDYKLVSVTNIQQRKKLEIQAPYSLNDLRRMKSIDQVKILENEFKKNPNWSKSVMRKLSQEIGLKESQIYKWNWDRRQVREKYIEGRLKSMDLPSTIFKITKVLRNSSEDQPDIEIDITNRSAYFKVLKTSSFNEI